MENTKEIQSAYANLLPQYKIEGFNPNAVLTSIMDIDENGQGKESLFMRYLPALEWFLTVHPDGCLNHSFIERNDRKATVTASIYRRQEDARPAMTATCTTYFEESPNGKFFEQNAVTAAYRKALGYLGFGTPLDAVKVEGIESESSANVPEKTEAGIIIAITDAPSEQPIAQPASSEIASLSDTAVKPTTKSRTRKAQNPAQIVEEVKEVKAVEEVKDVEDGKEASEFPANNNGNDATDVTPEPSTPTTTSSLASVSMPKQAAPAKVQAVPQNLEEALEIIVPRGQAVGQTIREAAKEFGGSFIRWHCDKVRFTEPGSPFAVATQLYCEFNGC